MKNVIEIMFNDLNDLSEGTDEEVRKELEEMGIDLDKARKSLKETMETVPMYMHSNRENSEDFIKKNLLPRKREK